MGTIRQHRTTRVIYVSTFPNFFWRAGNYLLHIWLKPSPCNSARRKVVAGARAASPLGLVRGNAQLTAFGKAPGGTGTGRPMLGDSGGWVFHCHINEHADQGMMSYFNLTAPLS